MVDNYELWRMNEDRLQAELETLPTCDYCGEYIQDDYYYEILGDNICEECLKRNFRKSND